MTYNDLLKYIDNKSVATLTTFERNVLLKRAIKKQIRKRLIFRLKAQLVGIQNAIVLIAIVWFRTGNIVLIADRLWILTVMGVTLNETQILQKMRLQIGLEG